MIGNFSELGSILGVTVSLEFVLVQDISKASLFVEVVVVGGCMLTELHPSNRTRRSQGIRARVISIRPTYTFCLRLKEAIIFDGPCTISQSNSKIPKARRQKAAHFLQNPSEFFWGGVGGTFYIFANEDSIQTVYS